MHAIRIAVAGIRISAIGARFGFLLVEIVSPRRFAAIGIATLAGRHQIVGLVASTFTLPSEMLAGRAGGA